MGPDFLTDTEQRELDNLVELQIDTAIEEKHLHEVDGLCSECEKPINSEYHCGKSCINPSNEDEFDR